MHKHVPNLQGDQYINGNIRNVALSHDLKKVIEFLSIRMEKEKNAQICPFTFLSLYAIITNNVIYELRYLILSIMSGIVHLHLSKKISKLWNVIFSFSYNEYHLTRKPCTLLHSNICLESKLRVELWWYCVTYVDIDFSSDCSYRGQVLTW